MRLIIPHILLLTNTQVSSVFKLFANGSSANIKFSKNQVSKMVQLGGFFGGLLKVLLKMSSNFFVSH